MAEEKKPATAQQNTALSAPTPKIQEIVLERIQKFKETGELKFPKDYSPENAIKAAFLLLQDAKTRDNKPVLEACTKESIASSMLKMVVLGLNPIKKQCNFIAYGDKLSCDMEYAGNIALAKRAGMKSITGVAIMDGDEFEFETDAETGRKRVTKHKQTLDSIGSPNIKGAYAVYEMEDGTVNTEIMNKRQIEQAWNQGASKGNSPAHKNFPDQMAIKTVINRACKLIIRTSDDGYLEEPEQQKDVVSERASQKIEQEANKKVVVMPTDAEIVEEVPTAEAPQAGNGVQVEAGF